MMHMGRKPPARVGRVRTTVTLDPDVAKILEALQRRHGLGLSEALNDAVRAGAGAPAPRPPFVQRTSPIGITGPVCTGEIMGMDDPA
jgi:Ribbon-helix-helix protein, copG family